MWIAVVLSENRLQGGDEGPHGIDLSVERINNVGLPYSFGPLTAPLH